MIGFTHAVFLNWFTFLCNVFQPIKKRAAFFNQLGRNQTERIVPRAFSRAFGTVSCVSALIKLAPIACFISRNWHRLYHFSRQLATSCISILPDLVPVAFFSPRLATAAVFFFFNYDWFIAFLAFVVTSQIWSFWVWRIPAQQLEARLFLSSFTLQTTSPVYTRPHMKRGQKWLQMWWNYPITKSENKPN